jgi:ABC-2 type transport system permease protein
MGADPTPVLTGVMRNQRRSLLLWSTALTGVAGLYISVYPAIGGEEMAAMVETIPEGMATAFGYDDIGTAGGYLSSTVYGLLGPVLLLVFAIATGTRLIAGQEEDGTLELELTAPVSRRRLLTERLGALWLNVLVLVAVLTGVTLLLVLAFDLDVDVVNVLAGSTGLLLLVLGFGTIGFAAGAATGRRTIGLGVGAGLAVLAFMFDAIGPTIDAGWMTAVSPFSWFLEDSPLLNGFDVQGLALLALLPVVAAAGALIGFTRRDLMV